MLNFVFLTTSLSTPPLHFLRSTGTVFNSRTSKSSTFVFRLFRLVERLVGSSMSSLSTSASKAIKPFLAAKLDALMLVACYNSF